MRRQTSPASVANPSPAQLDLGPAGRVAKRAKDAIRYAHGQTAVSQANETLRNYGKRLLSKQVARDVERITAFLCDIARRGVPKHLVKRCLELIGLAIDEAAPSPTFGPWDGRSLRELHLLEEELQGKREVAESAFIHEQTPATANALLNADDQYELVRLAIRRRALKVAAT